MRTKTLFIVILGFLVLSIGGPAYGWQGRMGGMGDPFGLVEDESDFLIHPAGIADGKGVNFYGNYRFTWTDVTDWDYTLKIFAPFLLERDPYRTSGDEWEHNALLGAAMPLGPGRMGIFFNYAGKRGDYDGTNHQETLGPVFYHSYKMESDLDSFALRLLYGLPMGKFKLGGEIQLAYRREENKTSITEDWAGGGAGPWAFYTNYPFGGGDWYLNLFPFMFPYDSKYWEGLLKGSLKGEMGPVKIAFTVKGGLILWGDNKYQFTASDPVGPSFIDGSGDVKGWSLGSDLWLRYPLSKDLSLPFLLKINYQKKTKTGEGSGEGSALGFGAGSGTGEYKSHEKNFQVDIGGGVDKEFNKGTRVAAGIYYSYIKNINNFLGSGFIPSTGDWGIINYSKYPDLTEHRMTLRIAGEKEMSPMIAMRMGLNFFYAWGKAEFNYSEVNTAPSGFFYNTSFDGSRWGIGGWLGGTVKLERFSLEPFLGGGYQKTKGSWAGPGAGSGMGPFFLDINGVRNEWFIGGGFSIKF